MINNTFIHKSNTMMKHQHGDLFFKFFYSQIPQNFFATSSLRSSVAKLPTLTGRSPPIPISLSSHVCLPRKGSGGAPRPKALAHPPTRRNRSLTLARCSRSDVVLAFTMMLGRVPARPRYLPTHPPDGIAR